MCNGVRINGQLPLVICICDYAPFVGCASGGEGSAGMPRGLDRDPIPRVPNPVLEGRPGETVNTALDAEYLRKSANPQHIVSGETVYDLLVRNLGPVWVAAYLGSQETVIQRLNDEWIVKRLKHLTSRGSNSQSTLEGLLAAMGAPDVPALFVGQRVWAPWLNDSNNIEGERWMAARVLGEGVPLRGSVRTYKLYYDIDAKIHHRGIPLTKGGHTMISTTNPL